MKHLVVAALLALFAGWPGGLEAREGEVRAQADSICPPEYPSARRVAFAFLTSRAYALERDSLGLVPADTGSAVLLRDETDAAACAALNASMAQGDMWGYPFVQSYYRVGNYYIAGDGVDPDSDVLYRSAIAVYDSSLNLLMVLGA